MSEVSDLINQAEKLKEEGKNPEAVELLQQALGKDENNVIAHLMIGRIFTQTGEHEKAIEHCEKACQLEPTDSFNFTAMSVTYQRAYAGTGDTKYIQMAEDAMAKSHALQG